LLTLFIPKRAQPSRASLFCRKRVFNIKRKSCCNIPPLVQSGPGKNIEASLYIYYDTKILLKNYYDDDGKFFGKFYYLVQISSSEQQRCIINWSSRYDVNRCISRLMSSLCNMVGINNRNILNIWVTNIS